VLLISLTFIVGGTFSGMCPAGWVELADTCSKDGGDVCLKIGQPIKFVSWSHLMYDCVAAGGYLPELTEANMGKLQLILKSYDQLFGETLMYLGATTVTRKNDWKWLGSKNAVVGANWGEGLPSKDNKRDCVAQSSRTTLWENIDCQDQNIQTQVAFVCMMGKKEKGEKSGGLESSVSGLLSSATPSVTPSVKPSCTNPKLLEPSKITCTVSSITAPNGCEMAFDGSADCNGYDWVSKQGDRVGAWIQADFGKSITITSVKILQPKSDEYSAKKITISFDNNVQNPAELNGDCGKGWNDISLIDPVESKTMKITFNEMIDDTYDDTDYLSLEEVEIYGCF